MEIIAKTDHLVADKGSGYVWKTYCDKSYRIGQVLASAIGSVMVMASF